MTITQFRLFSHKVKLLFLEATEEIFYDLK